MLQLGLQQLTLVHRGADDAASDMGHTLQRNQAPPIMHTEVDVGHVKMKLHSFGGEKKNYHIRPSICNRYNVHGLWENIFSQPFSQHTHSVVCMRAHMMHVVGRSWGGAVPAAAKGLAQISDLVPVA